MRLTSLVVLLALVGGAGYVLLFQRDWLFSKAEEGKQLLAGYSSASTPNEAMDLFRKAVKNRDYRAAAKYCTGDYAEQLAKHGSAIYEIGDLVDRVKNMMSEKGFNNLNAQALVYYLDPFPTELKVKDVRTVKGKKGEHTVGEFQLEERVPGPPNFGREVDARMFRNAFHPGTNELRADGLHVLRVELKAEGESDSKVWKLVIPLSAAKRGDMQFFLDNYRAYATGLNNVRELIRQGRFLPAQFEPELKSILRDCKQGR
jgi:hypothetical protein